MTELLLGALLIALCALFSFFNLWRKERNSRKDIEEKVRAHEELQRINDDIDNGDDVYLSEQLRKHTRDL
jgi:hypothetical protein